MASKRTAISTERLWPASNAFPSLCKKQKIWLSFPVHHSTGTMYNCRILVQTPLPSPPLCRWTAHSENHLVQLRRIPVHLLSPCLFIKDNYNGQNQNITTPNQKINGSEPQQKQRAWSSLHLAISLPEDSIEQQCPVERKPLPRRDFKMESWFNSINESDVIKGKIHSVVL